jgi:hypothetical protein
MNAPDTDPLDRMPRWLPAVTYIVLTVLVFRAYLFAPAGAMLYGSDTIAAGVMLRGFFVDAVRTLGHIPQWNPYLFSGLPYLEAGGGDTLYPTSILHFFLTMPQALAWKLILHVFVAGFSMYYCVRVFGGSRWVAYVAGGAHLLSAQMISQVFGGQDTKIYVAALFPMTLALLVRAIDRRSWTHFVWFGLFAGLLLLGHPVLSFYAWLVLGIWGLVMIWNRRGEGTAAMLQRFAGGAVSLATALALAMVVLWPMYHYLRNYSPRSGTGRGVEYAKTYPLNAPESVGLLIGGFAGSDRLDGTHYWGPNPLKGNLEYGGALVLVLGVTAIFALKGDRRRWGLGLSMLLTWLYAMGDRPEGASFWRIIFALLKPTQNFRAPSLVMFIFFASALILTALLLDRMLKPGEAGATARSTTQKGLLIGAGVALLLTLIVQVGGPSAITALFGQTEHPEALANNIGPMVIGGWIAMLACLGMWGLVQGVGKGTVAATAMLLGFLGITTVDLLVANTPFVNARPYANYFPTRGDYDQLKGLLGPGERVLPSDHVIQQGSLATYGVPEAFGYHGNEPRWYDVATIRNFRDQAYYSDQQQYNGYLLQLMTSGMGRALAIRVAILPPTDIPITGWERLGANEQYTVYRSKEALPGGALISTVMVEPDTMKVLQALWNPGFDAAKVAFVAESVPGLGTAGGKGSFQITSEASDSVVVQVTTDAPALVLLSRTWHPYWKASVDGGAFQDVVRTDYTLMGVPVGAGTHTIVFHYRSPVIAKAELVSGAAWSLILLTSLWALVVAVRGRKQRV